MSWNSRKSIRYQELPNCERIESRERPNPEKNRTPITIELEKDRISGTTESRG